ATVNLLEFVSLCKEADDFIRKILIKSPKLNGMRLNTLKASVVHYLARKKGLNVTLNSLYHIYSCCYTDIIRVKKVLESME
ncbi:unnamed protein product, partial [marine sediment metagenome]